MHVTVPDRGGLGAGFLFEGVVGRPTNDWDQARQAAEQVMALPLDHTSRPLRIRVRRVQLIKI